MKRIALFLATNLAIVLVLSITMRVLGVAPFLNEQGLNPSPLLAFAAVLGFGGAFISLALSKWTAKRMTGAVVIGQPRTPTEVWLIKTVRRQARAAVLAGRSKMIAALERLKAAFEPCSLPKQMAAFGIAGGTRGGLKRLFASHPGLNERIAALRGERV